MLELVRALFAELAAELGVEELPVDNNGAVQLTVGEDTTVALFAQVDRTLLSRLASETLGQTVAFDEARAVLPTLIPSAAKIIPVETSQPLWDAPLVMALFVGLITLEWVLRKVFGML